MNPKKVIVVAPLLSKSGYGVHARFVVDALSTRPDLFDLYVSPLTWGESSWMYENTPKRKFYDFLIQKGANFQGPFDISVQVTVPTEWQNFAKINVGVTAGVETNKVPLPWLQRCNSMDKLIVTSQHTKSTFTQSKYDIKSEINDEVLSLVGCQKPVEVVTYPVKNLTPVNVESRVELPCEFNFLSVTQIAPRKNMEKLIQWFIEEFRNEDVGLVLKAHGANNSTPDRERTEGMLRNFIAEQGSRQCKIHHIHGSMTDEELHGLYIHPKIKCYVTATHGEGFGLPIYEAAYSGLPVIAPNWSGHKDFLSIEKELGNGRIKKEVCFERVSVEFGNIPEHALMPDIITADMSWCNPKEDKFKRAMRNVYTQYVAKKKTAEKLQKYLVEKFSEENQFACMCNEVWTAYENETTAWTDTMEEVQTL
jgi:glycosyltransferase involved in cell wall biosynthesis